MSGIDQGYAAWLKAESLTHTAISTSAARWPTQGLTAATMTPFSTAAGAQAEGARVVALLAGPLVRDTAVVPGEQRHLIGRCVTLVGTQLGYDAGVPVLVIGVVERAGGTSVLTILRSLG